MRQDEHMYRLVEEFISSGLSRRAFADLHKVKVEKFDYWRKKYRSKNTIGQDSTSSNSPFIEISPTPASGRAQAMQARIELELAAGILIRIY